MTVLVNCVEPVIHSYHYTPTLCSLLNGLQIDSIPDAINCLSSLEKKLLARIQICMTVVLLPGGQYAEKGLIVDLLRDVELVENLNGIDTCVY